MCDVRRKLILTNVVIEKYRKWQEEVNEISEIYVYKGFSTTLLMKLLYLSCLFSIKGTQEKTYRKTPFGVLDKWIALPNGPAEDDVYSAIGYQPMPTVVYDLSQEDGCKYSKFEIDKKNLEKIKAYYRVGDNDIAIDNVLDDLVKIFKLEEYRLQIEGGFDTLVERIKEVDENKKIDVSTQEKNNCTIDYLSNLTHLILWNAALNRDEKRLATNNIYLLKDEYGKLEKHLNKQN